MKCGSCIYWENDVCYRKGTKVSLNNNICEDFVNQYNNKTLEDEYGK